jgi:hypothetical protein
MMSADSPTRQLRRYFWLYAAGFCALLGSLAILELEGFPRFWLGYLFLFTTIVVYAAIGVLSRTSDVDEYFVAGRRIPPVFNGMATAADWISTASFIGLAGGLYLHGFDGLAYILGCLADRALLASTWAIHGTGLPCSTLRRCGWRWRSANDRGDRNADYFIHLCGGTNLRRGTDYFALHRN